MEGFDLSKIEGFEWDKGNVDKNFVKHKISNKEAEEVFFDEEFIFNPEFVYKEIEDRYQVIGKTQSSRLLSVIFTIRRNKIRVISVRKVNTKELKIYEKIKNTKF